MRSPGWPTVPATNLSGMSYAMTGMRTTLRSATDGRVTVLAGLRKKIVDFPAVVVQADHEGTHLGVTDHGHASAGSAWMRWNWSRCSPRASATIDLMMSPWLHTRNVASRLEAVVPLAYGGHGAVLGVGQASPPGKRTALGWAWTTFQRSSLASSSRRRPVQSPYLTSPNRSSVLHLEAVAPGQRRPARSPGSGPAGSPRPGRAGPARAAPRASAACVRPRSFRCTPGVQPASTGPVISVSP